MTSRFSAPLDRFTLERAKRGDMRAHEAIYRQYERAVFGLARRLSDQLADAEEITQEVFVRAFTKLSDFRAEAPFGFWLRGITVNQAMMWRRQQPPKLDTSGHDEVASFRFPVQLDLAQALSQLAQPTRGILWLYFVEGFSHQEIADLHRQSVSFSKSQVARGCEQLRGAFRDEPATMALETSPEPAAPLAASKPEAVDARITTPLSKFNPQVSS